MPEEIDSLDRRISAIAEGQHGVVTFRQHRAAGFTGDAVLTRVRSGRLHRLHRGVYAVGHRAPSREREWMAAVLACGDGAALSHRSAGALWGLFAPAGGPVDVSVPSQAGRARRVGIRVHRCRSLTPELVIRRQGIPVTTTARTLFDLKRSVPGWLWRKAVRQAEFKGLDLGSAIVTDGTRSDLERDFLELCRRNGFPVPEVNVKVGGWTVDFLWREQRIGVETDFYDYHRGKVAFQDDRRRDLELRSHGLDVRRYSEEQLNDRPQEVVSDLCSAFAATPREPS